MLELGTEVIIQNVHNISCNIFRNNTNIKSYSRINTHAMDVGALTPFYGHLKNEKNNGILRKGKWCTLHAAYIRPGGVHLMYHKVISRYSCVYTNFSQRIDEMKRCWLEIELATTFVGIGLLQQNKLRLWFYRSNAPRIWCNWDIRKNLPYEVMMNFLLTYLLV